MYPRRLAAALPMGALALTLATTAAAAWPAQDGRGPAQGPRVEARAPGTVSVTGVGESTVVPDMAVITLGVTVQAPSADEAMRRNTEAQQVVIDTLKARGIEGRDIQTSGLNLTPMQDFSREGQPPLITGYQATNMVTVRVRDLPRLGEALDALVGAGANEIHGIGFQRENIENAEGDARARAVENARLRAEIMANAAGLELGRLVEISDLGGRQGPQPMMRTMAMDSAASAPVPIEAGELSVVAEVNVTWELRPVRRGDRRRGPGRDWQDRHGTNWHDMDGPGMGHHGMHGHASGHFHSGHHDMGRGPMGMDGMPMHRGMGPGAMPGGRITDPGTMMDRRGPMMPTPLPAPETGAAEDASGVSPEAAAAARAATGGDGQSFAAPVVVPPADATAGTGTGTAAPAAARPPETPPDSEAPSVPGEAPATGSPGAAGTGTGTPAATGPSVTPPAGTPAAEAADAAPGGVIPPAAQAGAAEDQDGGAPASTTTMPAPSD